MIKVSVQNDDTDTPRARTSTERQTSRLMELSEDSKMDLIIQKYFQQDLDKEASEFILS